MPSSRKTSNKISITKVPSGVDGATLVPNYSNFLIKQRNKEKL